MIMYKFDKQVWPLKIYCYTFKKEREKSSESCFNSVKGINYFIIIWYYFIALELPILYMCNNNNNLKNIYSIL